MSLVISLFLLSLTPLSHSLSRLSSPFSPSYSPLTLSLFFISLSHRHYAAFFSHVAAIVLICEFGRAVSVRFIKKAPQSTTLIHFHDQEHPL